VRRTLTVVAVLLGPTALLAGCATDALDPPEGAAARGAKKVQLSVTGPSGGLTTQARSVRVAGRVTRGASVRVGGEPVMVSGRRFRARVSLRLGRNRIRVVARKAGRRTTRRAVTVTREAVPAPVVTPEPTPAPTPEPAPEPSCHASYEGGCLDPNSYDYDCEGGSGDGPDYTGTVRVVGDDVFDLDRDGDGIACDV
jgi:hypothetical protein